MYHQRLQTGFINLICKKIRRYRHDRYDRHRRNTCEARKHRRGRRETEEELSETSELSEFESDDGESNDESEIRITPPEYLSHKSSPRPPSSTCTPQSSATGGASAHMMGNTNAKLGQLKFDGRVGLRCKECIARHSRCDLVSGS